MTPLEVDVRAARELLAAGEPPRLIDCREPDEFAICKIASAELLPLSRFAEEASQKLTDRNEPILIYCHHGMRSLRAAEYLAQLGYRNARSLSGGIDAWSVEIDPGVPRY